MEQIKDTGLMRPDYTKDGIPECDVHCPSRSGLNCEIQGCRAGLICRPGVAKLAAEVDRLKRDYELFEEIAPPDVPRVEFVKWCYDAWDSRNESGQDAVTMQKEIDRLSAELATLEPYRPLAKRADFKTVAGLLTGLCDFLMKSIEKPQQEWMTDFMTRTHDGKTHDLIRLWISHGKTPVERVQELIEERAAMRQMIVEWARDLDALDTDDAEFTDRALDRIAREMRGEEMPSEYPKRDTCTWSPDEPFNDDDNRYFTTSCKHDFIFNDGRPAENGFKYCPFCGKPIEVEELEEMLEEAGKC